MTTVDTRGNKHDSAGRFAGHVAGESSLELTADPRAAQLEVEASQLGREREALRNNPDADFADAYELDEAARCLDERRQVVFPPMKSIPKSSPWGKVQRSEELAPGMVAVSTAGHGGLKLSSERNRAIPAALRRRNGWYEEDCEAAIPAMVFAREFSRSSASEADIERMRASCEQTVKDWFPDEYESATGHRLGLGESIQRDRRLYEERLLSDGRGEVSGRPENLADGFCDQTVTVPGLGRRRFRMPLRDVEDAKEPVKYGRHTPWSKTVSLERAVEVSEFAD